MRQRSLSIIVLKRGIEMIQLSACMIRKRLVRVGLLVCALQSSASDGLAYGDPGRADLTVDHVGFALGYSKAHLQPRWVAYRLTKEQLSNVVSERSQNYFQDRQCFPGLVASADYKLLGCHVGHMAPAQDMKWNVQAELESFYFSNMCPQWPGFNYGIWKELEGYVRGFAFTEGRIFVVTGPVLSSKIATSDSPGGRLRIPIPEYFYKVVLDETPPKKMIGFVIPHKEGLHGVKTFACKVDQVEMLTGLDFFKGLPKEEQEQLESTFDIDQWTWIKK